MAVVPSSAPDNAAAVLIVVATALMGATSGYSPLPTRPIDSVGTMGHPSSDLPNSHLINVDIKTIIMITSVFWGASICWLVYFV